MSCSPRTLVPEVVSFATAMPLLVCDFVAESGAETHCVAPMTLVLAYAKLGSIPVLSSGEPSIDSCVGASMTAALCFASHKPSLCVHVQGTECCAQRRQHMGHSGLDCRRLIKCMVLAATLRQRIPRHSRETGGAGALLYQGHRIARSSFRWQATSWRQPR
eukprot:scaffold3804_cov381-Prasinococcus_capsulatus_cf.AAC.3